MLSNPDEATSILTLIEFSRPLAYAVEHFIIFNTANYDWVDVTT